jgi:hypothetical protein
MVHGACMWSESVQGSWFSSTKRIILGHVGSDYLYVNRVISGHVVQIQQVYCVGTGWFRFVFKAESMQINWFSPSKLISIDRLIQGACMRLNQCMSIVSVPTIVIWWTGWLRVHVCEVNQFRVGDSVPTSGLCWNKMVHGTCMWSESVQGSWFSSNKRILMGHISSEYLYVNRVILGHVVQIQQVDYVGTDWFRFMFKAESMQINWCSPSKLIYIYRLVQGGMYLIWISAGHLIQFPPL